MQDLTISELGGYCPVQGSGKVGGHNFYFRARGQSWQFRVAHEPDGDPMDVWENHALGFYREDKWGDDRFAAGYMPLDVAEDIIKRCAAEYLESRLSPHGDAD